jgi:hypothetical protein
MTVFSLQTRSIVRLCTAFLQSSAFHVRARETLALKPRGGLRACVGRSACEQRGSQTSKYTIFAANQQQEHLRN